MDISKSFVLKVKNQQLVDPPLSWDVCNNTQLAADFTLTQDGTFFQKIPINYANDLYNSNIDFFKLKVVSSRDTSCSYLDIDISNGKLILTRDHFNSAEFKFVNREDFNTPNNNMNDVVNPYLYLQACKKRSATKKTINPSLFTILSKQTNISIISPSGQHMNVDFYGAGGLSYVNMTSNSKSSNLEHLAYQQQPQVGLNDWTNRIGQYVLPLEASGTFMYKSATQLHNCNITLDADSYSNTALGGDYSSYVANTNNINNMLLNDKAGHAIRRTTMLRLDGSHNPTNLKNVVKLPLSADEHFSLRNVVAWTYMSSWKEGGRGMVSLGAEWAGTRRAEAESRVNHVALQLSGSHGGVLIGANPNYFENYNSQAENWCIGNNGHPQGYATRIQRNYIDSVDNVKDQWGVIDCSASCQASAPQFSEKDSSLNMCLSAMGTTSVGELIVLWNHATWVSTSDVSFVTDSNMQPVSYKRDMMTCAARFDGSKPPTIQKSLNGLVICNRHLDLSGHPVEPFLRNYAADLNGIVDRPANFFIPMGGLTSAFARTTSSTAVQIGIYNDFKIKDVVISSTYFDRDNPLYSGVLAVSGESIYSIIEKNSYVKNYTNMINHIPKKTDLDMSGADYWNENYGGIHINSDWTVGEEQLDKEGRPYFKFNAYSFPYAEKIFLEMDKIPILGNSKTLEPPELKNKYAAAFAKTTDFTVVDPYSMGLDNPLYASTHPNKIGEMNIPKSWVANIANTFRNKVDQSQDNNFNRQMSETAKIFGANWFGIPSDSTAIGVSGRKAAASKCGTGVQYISRMQSTTALWKTDNTKLVAVFGTGSDNQTFLGDPANIPTRPIPSLGHNVTALTSFPISTAGKFGNTDVFSWPSYVIDSSYGAALIGDMTALPAGGTGAFDMSMSWQIWNESNKVKNPSGADYTLDNHGIVKQLFVGNAWVKYTNPFGANADVAFNGTTINVCPPGALYNSENTNSCFFNASSNFVYEPVLCDHSGQLLDPGIKAFKLRGENNNYLACTQLDISNIYFTVAGKKAALLDEDIRFGGGLYKLVVVDIGGKHDSIGNTVFYHDTLEMSGSVISSAIYAKDPDDDQQIWLSSLVLNGSGDDSYYKFNDTNITVSVDDDSSIPYKKLQNILLIKNLINTMVPGGHVEVSPVLKTRYEFNNLSFTGVLKFDPEPDGSLGTVTLMSVNSSDLKLATNEINLWDQNQPEDYVTFPRYLTDNSFDGRQQYNQVRNDNAVYMKTYSNLSKMALSNETNNSALGWYTDIPKTSSDWLILQNNYIEINSNWNVTVKPSNNLFAKAINKASVKTDPYSSHQYSSDKACFYVCAQDPSCNAYSFTSSVPCFLDASFGDHVTIMQDKYGAGGAWNIPNGVSFEELTCKYQAEQKTLLEKTKSEELLATSEELAEILGPWYIIDRVVSAVEITDPVLLAAASGTELINSYMAKFAKWAQMFYFGYGITKSAVSDLEGLMNDQSTEAAEQFYSTGFCNLYSEISDNNIQATATFAEGTAGASKQLAAQFKFNSQVHTGTDATFGAFLLKDVAHTANNEYELVHTRAAIALANRGRSQEDTATVASLNDRLALEKARFVAEETRGSMVSVTVNPMAGAGQAVASAAETKWNENLDFLLDSLREDADALSTSSATEAWAARENNNDALMKLAGNTDNVSNIRDIVRDAVLVQKREQQLARLASSVVPTSSQADLGPTPHRITGNLSETVEAAAGGDTSRLREQIRTTVMAPDGTAMAEGAEELVANSVMNGGGVSRASALLAVLATFAMILTPQHFINNSMPSYSYVRNLDLAYSTDERLSSFNNCFNDTIEYLDNSMNIYKNNFANIEGTTNSRRFFNYVANTVCSTSSSSQPNGVKYMNQGKNPDQSNNNLPTAPILFPTPLAYYLTSNTYDASKSILKTNISNTTASASSSYVAQLIAINISFGQHINFTDNGKLSKLPNTRISHLKKDFGTWNFLDPLNTTVHYVKTVLDFSGIGTTGVINTDGYQDFVLSDVNSNRYICYDGSGVKNFSLHYTNLQNTLHNPAIFRSTSGNKLAVLDGSGESQNITYDGSFNTFAVGGQLELSEIIAPFASPAVYFEGGLTINAGANCIIGKNTACFVSSTFNNYGSLMNNGDLILKNTVQEPKPKATNRGTIINGDASGGARMFINNFDFNNGELELFALMDTCNNYLHYDWTTKMFSIKELIDPTIESFKQFYVIPATTNLPMYGGGDLTPSSTDDDLYEGISTNGDGTLANPIYELCVFDPSGATTRHANIFSSDDTRPMANSSL